MNIAELQNLPSDEKLKIIELLWSADDSLPTSSWHEEALRRTEADYQAGRIESLDWEDAKEQLRKRAKSMIRS